MMSGTSENVLLVGLTCSSTGHPAVGRFEWDGQAWVLEGASRQRPGSRLPASDSTPSRHGRFRLAPEYGGCPSCGADSFVRCRVCHELGCWDRTWPLFNCPSCGNSGPVEGYIDFVKPVGDS